VLKAIELYDVPIIKIMKQTPKEAVCRVFEKVNTGGVSLTVFELLTATFATDDFNLRDDWDARRKRFNKRKVLASLKSDDLLQAISLTASREHRNAKLASDPDIQRAPAITCKRKDLLKLTLHQYKGGADMIEKGFQEAAKLMHSQRIFDWRDLPYRTQMVPLAAIFTVLDKEAENEGTRAKLTRWFWCGVFGELYGGAIESRFARDLPEVLEWIKGGDEPSTVAEASFAASRLRTLRSRNSAAYKGLYALLLRDGGLDLLSGKGIDVQMYFDEKIEIHHIFPQKYCREQGIDMKLCDSIVNKTAVSARTNRIVGGNAPSEYLAKLKKQAGMEDGRMKTILGSHVIDADALMRDDFESFFERRQQALLKRIEAAMGKPVNLDIDAPQFPPDEDYLDEEETVEA